MSYVPSGAEETRGMLDAIGVKSERELFRDVPDSVYLDKPLNIPEGLGEMDALEKMTALAAENRVFGCVLRGAGAYNHYIPAIVKSVTAKEEFLTAYTPYQAEISQGVLQSIFEYQTMICRLTGMDVSNASVYDGASAAAEAVAMCRDRKRTVAVVSEAAHPDVIATIKTYAWACGCEVRICPAADGATDISALDKLIGQDVCCLYIQQPNFFGVIEDAGALGKIAHERGAKFIMGVNPIAQALLKTAGECGADVACGDGQPLGMPLSWGGPYLGFMACSKDMMRRLPGRIVGQTVDSSGERAFVLTLQAREQHIRREKASSNVCSNQALCALTAGVYMAAMGARGMREAAVRSAAAAHALKSALSEIPGFEPVFGGEFFHEFMTYSPILPEKLNAALAKIGVLGPLPVSFSGKNALLWCATELLAPEKLDAVISVCKEARA